MPHFQNVELPNYHISNSSHFQISAIDKPPRNRPISTLPNFHTSTLSNLLFNTPYSKGGEDTPILWLYTGTCPC